MHDQCLEEGILLMSSYLRFDISVNEIPVPEELEGPGQLP